MTNHKNLLAVLAMWLRPFGWAALPWLVLGLVLICLGLLPLAALSGGVLALSYDGHVEHLGVFVLLARCILLVCGLTLIANTFARVRKFTFQRLLRAPDNTYECDAFFWSNDAKALWIMTGIIALLYAPVVISLVTQPEWLNILLREDGPYESAGAVLLFVGSVIGAYAGVLALKKARPLGIVHLMLLALAVVLLFASLEEVSYGQRIFGFSTPSSFKSLNVQNEFNLHNVATGFTNRVFAFAALLGGFVLPIVASCSRRVSYIFDRLRIPLPSCWVALPFAAAMVFTTPSSHDKAVFDEQRLGSYIAIAGVLFIWVHEVRRKGLGQRCWALATAAIILIVTKAVLKLFDSSWSASNYPEEAKEMLIALGLFCYGIVLLRAQNGAKRGYPAAKGAVSSTDLGASG